MCVCVCVCVCECVDMLGYSQQPIQYNCWFICPVHSRSSPFNVFVVFNTTLPLNSAAGPSVSIKPCRLNLPIRPSRRTDLESVSAFSASRHICSDSFAQVPRSENEKRRLVFKTICAYLRLWPSPVRIPSSTQSPSPP